MSGLLDLGEIFKTIREVDLRPIRDEAEQQTRIVIVGNKEGGAGALASALYLSPRPLPVDDACRTLPGPLVLAPDAAATLGRADILILVLDEGQEPDSSLRSLVEEWSTADKPVLVVYNVGGRAITVPASANEWAGARVLIGSVTEKEFLDKRFAPAVLQALPTRKLSLARNFPLLRIPVAREIISDTSIANASYAFGTGLAEIVPALTIPFNVADLVILTKAQAFMVYRLGLAFGLSTRWQDHLAAFGGTIGAGFLWRTLARQVVGLLPGLGVLPKTAIAYAGTFATGQAALAWYETGREVKREEISRWFREGLERGRAAAQSLARRAPRLWARPSGLLEQRTTSR